MKWRKQIRRPDNKLLTVSFKASQARSPSRSLSLYLLAFLSLILPGLLNKWWNSIWLHNHSGIMFPRLFSARVTVSFLSPQLNKGWDCNVFFVCFFFLLFVCSVIPLILFIFLCLPPGHVCESPAGRRDDCFFSKTFHSLSKTPRVYLNKVVCGVWL